MLQLKARIRTAGVVLISILAAGCGAGDSSETVESAQSQIIHLFAPPVCEAEFLNRSCMLEKDDDDSGVRWKKPRLVNGEPTVVNESLSLDDRILMMVARQNAAGERLLLIATVDSNNIGRVYSVRDLDGDGAPDASSATVLFDTGAREMFLTDIAFATDDQTVAYLLDRRCQDIWIARDTDEDGLPDTLDGAAFALSADFAGLRDATHLLSATSDTAIYSASNPVLTRIQRGRGNTPLNVGVTLTDTDSDGLAETSAANGYVIPLHARHRPRAGSTSLDLAGEPGRIVQVWAVGAGGANATLLGSGTLVADGTDLSSGSSWDAIALNRTLEPGDHLRARYQTAPHHEINLVVRESSTVLLDATPATAFHLAGGSAVLTGRGFTASMQVVLHTTADNVTTELVSTFVSATRIDVTIPALPPDAPGPALVLLNNDVNGETISVATIRVAIVDPDAQSPN